MGGFPGRLKMARLMRRLHGVDLAAIAEVDGGTISAWESDARWENASAAQMVRLAQALMVPVGWLIAKEGGSPVFDEADTEAVHRRVEKVRGKKPAQMRKRA